MPKILGYTPSWLTRGTPGYDLFAPKPPSSKALGAKKKSPGLRRLIAARDSEIFVAVGHEIRWADLAQLKEDDSPTYRTLKVSIPLPIERLTISPCGDYLAVSTSHTVHVVNLPHSSLLTTDDDNPIKPKTFQVGPTAHVSEESPVACVLWHPLGYHGRCLVTITREGVVRLWEINRSDRSSFIEPTLSIDLEKLANATNDKEDLSASKFGASKGFSPDAVDLEVASACFGDFPEQEGVHGWAPMTLWIATVAGGVYALCPLLPSKWQLSESPGTVTLVQTLISSININHADVTEDINAPQDEKLTADKQLSWISDILYQEPFQEDLPDGETVTVFTRPTSVAAVPLLQGPFSIIPEVDDFELSDMIVFSLKTFSDGSEDEAAEGLPAAVICLLTDTCEVHVCLDLEGIVGQWLPSETESDLSKPTEHALVVAETIILVEDGLSSPDQSITPDVHTDFSFFVSHACGAFYISLEPWIRRLEKELSAPQNEGADFRLKRLLESANTLVEPCIRRQRSKHEPPEEVTASIIIADGNVGYLLLTTVDNEPQAVLFDAPEEGVPTEEELALYLEADGPAREIREAWRPPKELWEHFDLFSELQVPHRHKAMLKEEIRLSPANLELLMSAHRALAAHTDRLQHAVSDLFNRCQRLQDEYKDQIWRTAQLIPKIEAIPISEGEAGIDERLERVKAKQDEINSRFQALRKRMANVGGAELSEKEASFVEELQTMESSLDQTARTLTDDVDGSVVPAWQRYDKVKEMKASLAKDVDEAAREGSKERAAATRVKVPSHSRKQENEQIQRMLQHQTDLLEATTGRLRSLGISIPTLTLEGGN